jgi:hypothetical protein
VSAISRDWLGPVLQTGPCVSLVCSGNMTGLVHSLRIGPCCQLFPGSDLVQFSRLGPVSVWFVSEMCMTWSILDPGVSYFQRLAWSGLCRLDPVVSFGFLFLGTRGMTWSSLFRLDPGVSLVPIHSLAWFSLSRLDPGASLVYLGRHMAGSGPVTCHGPLGPLCPVGVCNYRFVDL